MCSCRCRGFSPSRSASSSSSQERGGSTSVAPRGAWRNNRRCSWARPPCARDASRFAAAGAGARARAYARLRAARERRQSGEPVESGARAVEATRQRRVDGRSLRSDSARRLESDRVCLSRAANILPSDHSASASKVIARLCRFAQLPERILRTQHLINLAARRPRMLDESPIHEDEPSLWPRSGIDHREQRRDFNLPIALSPSPGESLLAGPVPRRPRGRPERQLATAVARIGARRRQGGKAVIAEGARRRRS